MKMTLTQFNRILVPVDFSDDSQSAIQYAAWLGESLHSHVDLLHVFQPSSGVLPEFVLDVFCDLSPQQTSPREALSQFAHTDAGHKMRECLGALEQRAIEAHGRLAVGDPSEAIVTVAEQEHYSLIIMTTHGTDSLIRRTVTEQVVQRAPCPVITIRISTKSNDIS